MTFWKFIEKNLNQTKTKPIGTLESKLKAEFSQEEDTKLAEIACISGLLARVAFVDLNIDESEKTNIQQSLKKWLSVSDDFAQKLTKITCTEIQALAGTENHQYTNFLKENMSETKRYQVLEMLFSVAASDGNADNAESEEIRIITKGLGLEHKHFVSARISVKEYLGSLKSN
jgi:uncharacterized tellurite resistance protein B-like protein